MSPQFPLDIVGELGDKSGFTDGSVQLWKGQFGKIGVTFFLIKEYVLELVWAQVFIDGKQGKRVDGEGSGAGKGKF
jgi:hypothetical protein